MKSSIIKITTAISLIFLITLIVVFQLQTKSNSQKSPSSPSQLRPTLNSFPPHSRQSFLLSPNPTKTYFRDNSPTPTFNKNYLQQILSQLKPLEKNKLEKMWQLQKNFPLETADFYVIYSSPLEKFIIQEKTNKGKENFFNYLNKHGFSELINENIFVFTNQSPHDYEKNENQIIYQNREKKITANVNQISPIPPALDTANTPASSSLKLLIEILNAFINNINNAPSTNMPPNYPTPPLYNFDQPTIPVLSPIPPRSLEEVFTEVSQKVGVPKRILEAIVKIELPATFRLPADKIALYSTPGNYWPSCQPNECSATGPTQMTIGFDNQGSPTCSSCCWQGRCLNSCVNQWRVYGNAVNTFTGEGHQPHPCNIRDNIFAAAAKLKNDSGASNPISWSKEEVFRAGKRYYGDCTVTFKRLGNRTYCQFVWDYYQNRL